MRKLNATVSTRPVARLTPPAVRGEVLPPLRLVRAQEKKRFKFTDAAVDRLPAPDPSGRQKIYWDEDHPGFGVLVSGVSATKTYVVQRKAPGGKTCRVKIDRTDRITLDNARIEAEPIFLHLRKGITPKAAKKAEASAQLTLKDALTIYLDHKRKRGGGPLRQKSKNDYRACVERNLQDWLDKPLREITPDMVAEKHAEIKRGIDRGEKGNKDRSIKVTGNATADGVMRILSAIWNYSDNHRPSVVTPFPANPVGRLRSDWFGVTPRNRLVKGDDLPTFHRAVQALPNLTARDYILLLLFTGMRRREAAGLRWDDLDFANRLITIPEDRTKTGSMLKLPMSDLVYRLLVARKKVGRDKSGYVFAANGKNGHLEEPKSFFSQVKEATGIAVSPHDLRRTFVTVAVSAGVSGPHLKGLVNHKLGKDVTSGYVVLTSEDLRKPAQQVADRIRELCRIRR
jgi:integrase